jgi:hypothetical protein
MRFARTLKPLAAVAVVALVGWGISRRLPYESNPIVFASWTPGGRPMTVTFSVVGPNGTPLAGVNCQADNDSGGNGETTDTRGIAVVEVGEDEVSGIDIGTARFVMRRSELMHFFAPEAGEGLLVHVVVKNPAACGIVVPMATRPAGPRSP